VKTQACPHCKTAFLRTPGACPSSKAWPQYRRHLKACASASPEARAFWLAVGRWPHANETLDARKLSGEPRTREHCRAPEVP
jgi:hypothetical protein